MSGSKFGESGEHGKKKAKTGDLEDGRSSFRSWPPPPWCGMVNIPNGGIEDSGGSAWKQQENGGVEEELDPLTVFGSGIMMIILNKLDARSVAQARLVSGDWRTVASSDKIWAPKAAPVYWRNMDPYWQGSGTPMRRYFHPDGSITADADDGVWGGHESCYTVVTGLLEDGTIREHYVRINRWPQLSVQRKEDGSWKLSNHLYCYTTVPDPDREDGTGPPLLIF
ncbi:uncharacterized protein [Henckelia pumila]|uniref:uncharacterized protein isoform X2 n=1 Tax=Henckelia pumila TaxID=405737 RepID=UPI003C6E3283